MRLTGVEDTNMAVLTLPVHFIPGTGDAGDAQSILTSNASYADELELIKASKHELKQKTKIEREEQARIAGEVVADQEFRARLAEVIK